MTHTRSKAEELPEDSAFFPDAVGESPLDPRVSQPLWPAAIPEDPAETDEACLIVGALNFTAAADRLTRG
jgi:hypothetical protein